MAKKHVTALGTFTALHRPRVQAKVRTALQAIMTTVIHRLRHAWADKHLAKALIDNAAHEAATSPYNIRPRPSEAQLHAGNYKMGHIKVGGLDISIENPETSHRRPWWPAIAAHYGYIKGTIGADGDHVDVFVKPGTDSDWDGYVWVIDQPQRDGGFDEHKCMVGYRSKYAAITAYLSSYQRGWRLGTVTQITLAQFRSWLHDGDTTSPIGKMAKADPDKDEDEAIRAASFAAATRLLQTAVTEDDFQTLFQTLTPELRRQFAASGIMELTTLHLGGDVELTSLVNTQAVEYAESRSAELVGKKRLKDGSLIDNPDQKWAIDASTREMLLNTVAEGVQEGWSADTLAANIEENFAFSEARAAMIAQTELAFAYTDAHKQVAVATGAVGKMALLGNEHDDEVPEGDQCDDCADAGPVPFDEPFFEDYDFPPFHPNCVCDFKSIYPGDDEAEGLTDEDPEDTQGDDTTEVDEDTVE